MKLFKNIIIPIFIILIVIYILNPVHSLTESIYFSVPILYVLVHVFIVKKGLRDPAMILSVFMFLIVVNLYLYIKYILRDGDIPIYREVIFASYFYLGFFIMIRSIALIGRLIAYKYFKEKIIIRTAVVISFMFILLLLTIPWGYVVFQSWNVKTIADPRQMPAWMEESTVSFATGRPLPAPVWQVNNHSKVTVLIFHGLGMNKGYVVNYAKLWNQFGVNIVMPDLYAHGNSDGHFITYGYQGKYYIKKYVDLYYDGKNPIIIHGMSLGAATSLQSISVVDRRKISAVIADSSFTNLYDMISYQMRNTGDTVQSYMTEMLNFLAMLHIGCPPNSISPLNAVNNATNEFPILFVHTLNDKIIPAKFSQQLFEAKKGVRNIFLTEEGGHIGALSVRDGLYRKQIENLLNKISENNANNKIHPKKRNNSPTNSKNENEKNNNINKETENK